MSVLDRSALDASPLADLHTIASELSIDGYRRLRRADLIDAILRRQDGGDGEDDATTGADAAATVHAEEAVTDQDGGDEEAEPAGAARRRRGRRGGRGRSAGRDGEPASGDEDGGRSGSEDDGGSEDEPDAGGEELVSGVVELLANGSGFVRVSPPDPSDDDVYISSAQVKRCELVSGDRIEGPKRAPRRSERFASLVRIETINGRPAAELADGVRFDDLPAAFASERLAIGSDDPTLKAIEWLTPFGKGSRVTIVGRSRAGKSEALRRLAVELAGREDLTVSVVLAGVRPEEISDWNGSDGTLVPVAAVSFAASEEARSGAIEPAIDQARRLAARGADAVVLIDTLDGASAALARRAMASARNIIDGGSLTVISTATAPIGGETTVIALDSALAGTRRFPALDLVASGTLRPELLVGEAGAEAIARARAEAADGEGPAVVE
ncbi:MAG: Rho termination factor N-terminal domain-containing protein [Solirubrobacteraceae bacterium]